MKKLANDFTMKI